MTKFEAFVKRSFSISFIIAISLVNIGCSSTPEQSKRMPAAQINDPLESINRPLWVFTWEYADKYVTRPVTNAYVAIMPDFLRAGLLNMAQNLNEPSSMINNLLQGKFKAAGNDAGRFVLNSTVGLLGFYDPASDFDMMRSQEEFGEVLATYGVGDGAYLMIPVLGPSSIREEVGDFIDHSYFPIGDFAFWPGIFRRAIIGLEARADFGEREQIIDNSVDSYQFVKTSYYQNMLYRVYDGNPPILVDEKAEEELDEYLDLLEEIDEQD
ncbi:VacJ family lipoprotein [Thalassotalea sp. LPB0316]|uniref:MlaA family lipoprotein n=1 Tax=Thalassotalea sp. LPB0316 TaxID=2769490 RepID=UPI0018675922|nr:VacJ family lipoprotein [Thalassotalea sp. LPB0316]QOL27116.1 VacJ family lipoprotein [Thalassotalea sp. LPB0316]